MIQVIDGKRYNTETATEIACWDNDLPSKEFNFIEETLYRTPKGAFFLYGRGGANSPYAEAREGGQTRCSGSAITPLTPEAARSWLENHKQTEALEEYFADQIEDA